MLFEHYATLFQRCFNFSVDVISKLRNVEKLTSDFVSFSTSDRCYFNVDPQRSNNVDPTMKCWLGINYNIIMIYKEGELGYSKNTCFIMKNK